MLFCSLENPKKQVFSIIINDYKTFNNFIRQDSVHYTRICLKGGFDDKNGAAKINIDSFYNKLTQCISLRQLEISNFHLKHIDKRLFNIRKLQNLDLGENDIDTIPYQIKKLKHLIEISLRYNKLKSFNMLSSVPNLQFITLSHNSIHTIPDEIIQLKKLKVLHLGNNKITELPCSLSNFMELELSIGNNNIPKLLPPCFCKQYKSFGLIGASNDTYINCTDTIKNLFINPVW
jgi:Leucine-rich repeat (LRR) protein